MHMANIMQQEGQNTEHLLGIFASLLRLLPGGSAPRIRALAKFMEKDYEKIEKLIKLRREYAARVSPVELAIEKERKGLSQDDQEFMAGEWLSRRFDAGLFSLQVSPSIFVRSRNGSQFTNGWSRPLMLSWHGWSPKTMERRKRLSHFWQTAMRICPWFRALCKV
jgi:hypothetical protein